MIKGFMGDTEGAGGTAGPGNTAGNGAKGACLDFGKGKECSP
jgi:hypothetical protein